MTNPTFDFNALIDASKKAMAPAVKLNELSRAGFERIARQQYAFVGEMLEFSLQQWQVASSARDINDLTSRQIELSTPFAGPVQALDRAPGPADEVVRPGRHRDDPDRF